MDSEMKKNLFIALVRPNLVLLGLQETEKDQIA